MERALGGKRRRPRAVTRDVEQVTDSSKSPAGICFRHREDHRGAKRNAQITEAVVSITNQIEYISRATQEQHREASGIKEAVETMRDITGRTSLPSRANDGQ